MIAPDTRGVGESSLARNFTMEDVSDDLYELVRSMGYKKLVLVGQDFGVQFVAGYAAKHREDVRALVVMESPLSGYGLEELFAGFWHFGFLSSPFAEMLISGREKKFFERFAFGDFVYRKEMFPPKQVRNYIRNQIRPGRLAAGLDYYRALLKGKPFFQQTVCPPWNFPILALDGDHSMNGLTARSFEKISNNVKPVIVPECGHFVQEEQSDLFLKELRGFLAAGGD